MNPFKYNEATFTSGFYLDWAKKCICYLDCDLEDVMMSKTTYNRYSVVDETPSFFRPPTNSNIKDLVHLSYLEDVKITNQLDYDFEWILKDDSVKEEFLAYLLKEELYSLLHVFNTFANKIKEPEEIIIQKDPLEIEEEESLDDYASRLLNTVKKYKS